MRVLVCGGRDYTNRAFIFSILSRIHSEKGITTIIQGGARGADTIAHDWALENGVLVEEFLADWARYGKSAGSIRNQRMLEVGKPDLVLAFPGGRGTADMVRRAIDYSRIHSHVMHVMQLEDPVERL